jgi:hypothetical protein
LDEELDLSSGVGLGFDGTDVDLSRVVVEKGKEEGATANRFSPKRATEVAKDQLAWLGSLGERPPGRQPSELSHDAAFAEKVIDLLLRERHALSEFTSPGHRSNRLYGHMSQPVMPARK